LRVPLSHARIRAWSAEQSSSARSEESFGRRAERELASAANSFRLVVTAGGVFAV
jgi:hypothetical protein